MSGDVTINILDGGANVQVPGASVQLKIAPASAGPTATITATKNGNTLASVYTSGPLVESGGMITAAGGTVLAMRAATATAGVASAVTMQRVGTSTCVVTVTGTPVDELYVVFKTVKGGTIGTAGITFQISLDAGRTYGPTIALGTAVTYAITGTGLTLAFAAGTLDLGDKAVFGTTPPLANTAGVLACLTAFMGSQYALPGIGSVHIVGHFTAADIATIQGYMVTLKVNKVFARAIVEAVDASPPAIWGGTGESNATWSGALVTEFASNATDRCCVNAGNYNMPTAFPTAVAGAPRYRRNLAWALAARQVLIPPQRHAGRVKDGALVNVVLDPTNDPLDGFVYHDERLDPVLDGARFCSARTRRKQGLFIANPNLMAAAGSVFTLLPLGNVMDVACGIVNQVGEEQINDDIQLNSNGTIYENAALSIESDMLGALEANMISKKEITSAVAVVNRTNNVQTTSEVDTDVTIYGRGYVLSETITIGFSNPNAAGG